VVTAIADAYVPHATSCRRRSRLYGVTLDELWALFGDGLCDVCREPCAYQIDHDHACCDRPGSCGDCVRGYLCGWCNNRLRTAHDDPDRMPPELRDAARLYLSTSPGQLRIRAHRETTTSSRS
jgi:hypothetical protein